MSNPLVVSANDAPSPLKVVGEEITVLASGEQTGSYEIFRQSGGEGSGPPPHSHPWDEAFYVIEGQVQFGVDDSQDLIAGPGTLVHVPGGSTHWFRFAPGGATMISISSHAGASALFSQINAELSPTNPDLGALVDIAAAHGLQVACPPELEITSHTRRRQDYERQPKGHQKIPGTWAVHGIRLRRTRAWPSVVPGPDRGTRST